MPGVLGLSRGFAGCGEYGRLDAGSQAELRKHFLREAAEHAPLGGVRKVDDEVLDPQRGVLVDDLSDPIRIAMQRVPRTDELLVLARAPGLVGDDPVDLALVA